MKALVGAVFSTALMMGAAIAHAETTQDIKTWIEELRHDAIRSGVSRALVEEALPDSFTPDPRVIRLDQRQPEKTATFEQYKNNVLTAGRIREGRQRMAENAQLLKKIGDEYGVEPEYIVALWGLETSFGRNMGNFETIHALTTLAHDGRRSDFFRRELIKALHIIDRGHIALHDMKGSWAGAMGQCQFMPSSFERFAQDYNKDGRRDIWGTREDVFASIAAYLSGSGWKKGQPWGYRVSLPAGFDQAQMGRRITKSADEWEKMGVRLADGKPLPKNIGAEGSIVQPGGEGYKAYIVYDNYRTIMQWNASNYFATTVVLFADQLK